MATTAVTKIGKQEIIDRVSDSTGISKKDTTTIINSTIDTISAALKKGESVSFIGFGTFKVQKVKAKMGRNIVTKEPLKIPAHKRVKFTAGKTLADSVRGAKK